MATRKTEEVVETNETPNELELLKKQVEELKALLKAGAAPAAAEPAVPVVDEWKEKRTIKLMRPRDTTEKSKFVAVNMRSFQIPYGISFEVPLPIYERLQICMAAEDMIYEVREEIPNEAAPRQ